MFMTRRPSQLVIDRFLRDSQELQLSYGPIGIVRDETPIHPLDEAIVAIGRGKADFDRARAALTAWKQFDIGWVEIFPRRAPVAIGTVVAVLIRHLGFWSLNGGSVLGNLPFLVGNRTGTCRKRPDHARPGRCGATITCCRPSPGNVARPDLHRILGRVISPLVL